MSLRYSALSTSYLAKLTADFPSVCHHPKRTFARVENSNSLCWNGNSLSAGRVVDSVRGGSTDVVRARMGAVSYHAARQLIRGWSRTAGFRSIRNTCARCVWKPARAAQSRARRGRPTDRAWQDHAGTGNQGRSSWLSMLCWSRPRRPNVLATKKKQPRPGRREAWSGVRRSCHALSAEHGATEALHHGF